jgi:serine/threonine protein kinase
MGVTDVEAEFRRLGPYVLLRASGAGGMARIDLALRGSPEAADVCVLKRLHADYRSPEQEARFRREAAIARRLSHDAIARTLGIDEIDGELLLLQELVMGVDLRRLTARVVAVGERLPVPLAVYVVSEVARALHYAHGFRKLGIVHRDVTPDNIMLAFSGTVKLVDFGIARSNADATLTQAGFVVGRPVYTAPEVWTGARADRRSDIYSLGVVLWQLLAGRPLEPADTTSNPAELNPDVPQELAAINLRAFDADPVRRHQSAGELQRALAPYAPKSAGARAELSQLLARHFDVPREQRMLADDVAHATPMLAVGKRSSASARMPSPVGKRNRMLLLAAAVLLLLDGGLWTISRLARRSKAASPTPLSNAWVTIKPDAPAVRDPSPTAATPLVALPSSAPRLPTVPAPVGADSVVPTDLTKPPAERAAAGASTVAGKGHAPSPRKDLLRPVGDQARVAIEGAHPSSTPVDVNNLLAEAQLNFDRGDLPAALALARKAAHEGGRGPAYILIGSIMMNERHYEDAERAFSEATLLDPKDPQAARLLAMVQEIRKMGTERR